MNSRHLHHKIYGTKLLNGGVFIYEVARKALGEYIESPPNEEELIEGRRICPLVDKVIKKNASPAFDLDKIEPEERDKMIEQLARLAESERKIYRQAILENKLKREAEESKEIAMNDQLTGLYNRHYLLPRVEDEMRQTDRSEEPMSILLIDIDYFKRINDTMGHPVGDSALQIASEILKNHTRESDIVGRYGGEEFLIILPKTNQEGAFISAEKLRKKVEEELKAKLKERHSDKIKEIERVAGTISIGTSTYFGKKKGSTSQSELIKKADTALYLSKEKGRNQTSPFKPELNEKIGVKKADKVMSEIA